jgi:hypothetical protein
VDFVSLFKLSLKEKIKIRTKNKDGGVLTESRIREVVLRVTVYVKC